MKPVLQEMKNSNPSFLLYTHYESEILSVRNGLLSSIYSKSERIAAAVDKILQKRINAINEKGIPHLFEIFPWLLRDLTNLDHDQAHDISINWLALYLYVSFLDDHLDIHTKIEPDEFIAASFLAQSSLINLFKIVNNTKYESLFKESLILSAKYELKDVIEKAIVHNDSFTKTNSATGKNAILLACAGALAASAENESDFIIDLTRELLFAVQLLDDLTDVEEDLIQGNITIPLNDIVRDCKLTLSSSGTIISLMIQSNSLHQVLVRIESSLSSVVALIHASGLKIQQSNSALQYFLVMLSKVSNLRLYIESIEDSYKIISTSKQEKVIKELEKKLKEIYCHT